MKLLAWIAEFILSLIDPASTAEDYWKQGRHNRPPNS